MTFQYVSVDEAIKRSGVRMVVVGGVPSPWGEAAKGIQRWLGKIGQGDRWSFCLTAGKMSLRFRRDNEQTSMPEPHTGLQDPMGKWIATGTLAE